MVYLSIVPQALMEYVLQIAIMRYTSSSAVDASHNWRYQLPTKCDGQ